MVFDKIQSNTLDFNNNNFTVWIETEPFLDFSRNLKFLILIIYNIISKATFEMKRLYRVSSKKQQLVIIQADKYKAIIM